MPDSPDFSKYLPNSKRFSLDDMGELAARLGSPVSYDRRGEVVWYDTFSGGLGGWLTDVGGAGSVVSLSAAGNYHWGYHALLTAGAVAGSYAYLYRRAGCWASAKFGVEFSFALSETCNSVDILIYLSTFVYVINAGVRYIPASGKWQVMTGINVWQDVVTMTLHHAGSIVYHHVKLVMDSETGRYLRLLLDNQLVDISSLGFSWLMSSAVPQFSLQIYNYGSGAELERLRIGHVLLTDNES